MNILIDVLPESLEVDGIDYPINSDFRTAILFELMMQDGKVSDFEKIQQSLLLFYSEQIPEDIHEAVEQIIWFYRCGNDWEIQKASKRQQEAEEGAEDPRHIYSFEYDADYIYAAFLSQYGIDLQDIEYLHWWKFRAMFRSLNSNCEFCKIMGYRATKITSKMPKEQRAYIAKMQRIHALPIPDDEQEKYDAITKALMEGHSVKDLL